MAVYDLLGFEVAMLVNEKQEPGIYEVTFLARAMARGTYLYRLRAGGFAKTNTMVLA